MILLIFFLLQAEGKPTSTLDLCRLGCFNFRFVLRSHTKKKWINWNYYAGIWSHKHRSILSLKKKKTYIHPPRNTHMTHPLPFGFTSITMLHLEYKTSNNYFLGQQHSSRTRLPDNAQGMYFFLPTTDAYSAAFFGRFLALLSGLSSSLFWYRTNWAHFILWAESKSCIKKQKNWSAIRSFMLNRKLCIAYYKQCWWTTYAMLVINVIYLQKIKKNNTLDFSICCNFIRSVSVLILGPHVLISVADWWR